MKIIYSFLSSNFDATDNIKVKMTNQWAEGRENFSDFYKSITNDKKKKRKKTSRIQSFLNNFSN